MKVSILMVTYGKDIEWAKYSLQSIRKFATGFQSVVVVVPNPDVVDFMGIVQGEMLYGYNEAAGKGMLHHMVKILQADEYCPGADAILHMDADCFLTSPITPETYIVDGKPVMCRQAYETFRNYAERYSWKACVKNATGIDPEYETMCRHPSVHLRDVYPIARSIIHGHTGMGFDQYILSCKNSFPQTFAEFPTLGAVAIAYFNDRYHWMDWPPAEYNGLYQDHMTAFWSHGGMDSMNDRHPGKTARQIINAALNENPT